MKKIITLFVFAIVAQTVAAAEFPATGGSGATSLPADTLSLVKNRTKHPFHGVRIDRGINKNKFALRGETVFGITASYGTIDTEDTDIGLILDKIKLNGSAVSVKPFIGFFYCDDYCIGLRFRYTRMFGNMGNLALNLGEANDIEVSLGNMRYLNNSYGAGLFHRIYVALDQKGHFGVFGELELSGTAGQSTFSYLSGDVWNTSTTNTYRAEFSFNPGVALYIFPNVCASISFGLGGVQYTHIRQFDEEHNFTGKRNFSKMRFRLNLADINVGVTIHLWNKNR